MVIDWGKIIADILGVLLNFFQVQTNTPKTITEAEGDADIQQRGADALAAFDKGNP